MSVIAYSVLLPNHKIILCCITALYSVQHGTSWRVAAIGNGQMNARDICQQGLASSIE
jgi:hypothetical protein